MHGTPPTVLAVDPRTLVGAGPLLATPQEDREEIRAGQDQELWAEVDELSALPLAPQHRERFVVAPLDLLPLAGGREFQLIELNGTGIGGLTNMPASCVAAVLAGLSEFAAAVARVATAAPVVLVGLSDRQWHDVPRANPLAYEKVLYADALARGFNNFNFNFGGGRAEVRTLEAVVAEPGWRPEGATVVLGYNREFLRHVSVREGQLLLCGVPVSGVVNDRLFSNIGQQVGGGVDTSRVLVANGCHVAGTDKGEATEILNGLLAGCGAEFPSLRRGYAFAWARDLEGLITGVEEWRGRGVGVIIKPCGTGGGDGIEFFLDREESAESVARRVRASVDRTRQAYGTGVFPYTLCEYLDGATWPAAGHRFFGHKYELRVVVYRDGERLRAFPSIIKFSCERYDPSGLRRTMLVNNVTSGAAYSGGPGRRFILPLCNRETLATLGLPVARLVDLCRFGTRYVHAVLDRLDLREGG